MVKWTQTMNLFVLKSRQIFKESMGGNVGSLVLYRYIVLDHIQIFHYFRENKWFRNTQLLLGMRRLLVFVRNTIRRRGEGLASRQNRELETYDIEK